MTAAGLISNSMENDWSKDFDTTNSSSIFGNDTSTGTTGISTKTTTGMTTWTDSPSTVGIPILTQCSTCKTTGKDSETTTDTATGMDSVSATGTAILAQCPTCMTTGRVRTSAEGTIALIAMTGTTDCNAKIP